MRSATASADESGRRPRNAAATRDAILQSALIAFTRFGYDGVGLREIAGQAGVTAILVNRYFGTKEKLFTLVVETVFADGSLFKGDAATLGERVANAMVAKGMAASETVDPLLLMLRSAASPAATAILRDGIARHFETPLARTIGGKDALERASLFLALFAGFQFMRDIIVTTAMAEADPAGLAKRLAAMLKPLIEEKQGKKSEKSQQLTLLL